MQYLVEVDSSDPKLPRLNGPFDTLEAATGWGDEHIANGSWGVSPISPP